MPSLLDAARFLIFRVPLVLKTALFHVLKLNPTSTKWDLRTALTVTIIRNVLCNSPPSTISMQQRSTIQDPGVKGRMWGAIRDVLSQAIRAIGTGDEEYLTPALAPVTAEWTGYRASVPHNAPEPSISEADKYKCLMEETTTDVTLLYFHGGSYYLMDPCSHREVVASYAQLTGGRVLSVRYRLAPQNPFPSALLDALVVYLSLLYPPEGALHSPVPPSHVVFGGDSAGGNLATVLLQTILQLHRGTPDGDPPVVIFHGKPVKVPLPAGIALGSPSLDLTRSMQSSKKHAHALCHPLVSPVAAPSWRGSPPIFVSCGEELLTDECKVFAQMAARQGVTVVWEQYEAMPHCFAHILQGTLTSSQSLESYASFVTRAVQNPSEITTNGKFFAAKSLESSSVDVCNLNDTTEEEVLEGLKHARDKIVRNFQLAKQ
ncbi:alpha/beta hydrolase [Aspergillus novofumigatus IBT 16806]|uniref:Lipase/esterase n=1 Tax=Aspergillus novofumigatus (strain IBT 16806) TaxID=1392255 RepID=A0A2I1C776_ASPN1|nr:lipase/esterase [Aspergillus novofumigatus IBT 16806]PKX93487.1 lipase/esterase [Aspergillus novofumigatus IBT 16806]